MVKLIQVGGNYVVECPHCYGTSLCQHSIEVVGLMESRELEHFYWQECPTCGKGQKGLINATHAPEPKPPVCKVCGGRGYSIVQVPAESIAPQAQDRVLNVQEFLQMVDEEE